MHIKYLKTILSITLFFCLTDMPYWYFQFVRLFSTIVFVYFAYKEYEVKNNGLMIAYIALSVLFQPFYKIALGRELWNIVDVLVAVFLIVTLFIKKR